MQDLISINYKANEPTVLGRDLHIAIKVETPYRIWFPRMAEYGFVEGNDYTPYIFVHPQNGQNVLDHILTLDMAKEICMLQRTDEGKRFRKHFIAVEKAWNNPEAVLARAMKSADATVKSQTEQLRLLQIKSLQLMQVQKNFQAMATLLKNTTELCESLEIAEPVQAITQTQLKQLKEGKSRQYPNRTYDDRTKFITYNGQTKSMAEWAREANTKYDTFKKQMNRGWTMDELMGKTKHNRKRGTNHE